MAPNKKIANLLLSSDYILIENLETFKYLKKFFPYTKANLISFNPSLSINKKLNIFSLDKNLSYKYFHKLNLNLKKYSNQIYNLILKEKKNIYLARVVSSFLISKENLLVRLHQITTFCKKKKIIAIEPNFINTKVDNSINNDLYKALKLLDNVNVIKFDELLINQNDLARDPKTNFWIRFNFESLGSISFRVFVILSKYMLKLYKKNIVFYSHENSLLKGSAAKLFLKGFMLKKLSLTNKHEDISSHSIKLTKEKKVLNMFIKNTIGNNNYIKIYKYLVNELNNEISKYYHYKKTVKKIIQKNAKALLVGTPSSLQEIAAIEVANNRKIISASFQHGISKEISKNISCLQTTYETNLIKFYFIYNQEILSRLLENKFSISENIKVGLPEDMRTSTSKKILNNQKGVVLYASTNLYCGNRGIPSRSGASDLDKLLFELKLINNVFKKVSKELHYKPYFSKRYSGPNIELEIIKSSKNIKLIEKEIDLRYLVKYYKIIITSRATSTVGWCLFSKKPIIYIETIDNRLNKKAYDAFKKNLFFFDTRDKNWIKDLKALLSKPTLEIERIWNTNASSRNKFIKKFFGDISSNAEYKCAKVLFEKIKTYDS